MKSRKELPRFGYLAGFTVDVAKVLDQLKTDGLLNWDRYTDIKVSSNSKHKDFVVANEFCKDNFFKEEEAPMMEGENYRQVYLTDFDETKSGGEVKFEFTNIFKRTRRLDPSKSEYLPEADELNYGVRNELVTGELEKILDMFPSKLTRVRLAYLKDHFDIKPHVDYDPSYIVRYHIPLITNTDAKMFMERGTDLAEIHLPADGKVYFFNSGLKHWVKNDGDEGRLHLIIDVHGQQELENLVELIN
jgi:hypothetical protein